nr:GNAT family protein [uncultured Rhodoferax sp.]
MQADFGQQLCVPIETPRLLLLPRMGSHADGAFGPLQAEAIYEWISMDKPTDLEAMRAHWTRLESRLSTDCTEAWPVWAVTTRTYGTLIGQVDACVDDARVCTNLGYYLYPDFWGQGYASEAVRAIADHLVLQGIHRLVATVTVGNHASAQVLKKAGFSFTRIIPENDVLRGEPVDDEEYVRTA